MPLPVSIIIPTLNCRSQLEQHVAALRRWYHDAEEVIVVDSESDDGTAEWLRENLDHPRARHFSRPRGLYGAWNFAVSQCAGKYLYFATMGDEIQRDGVARLVGIAEKFDAELVLSPPEMTDSEGVLLGNGEWPIHRFMRSFKPIEAILLSDMQKNTLSNAFNIQGLLGSSASNLYQRSLLMKCPFPEDFGHVGDTMWGRRYGCRTRVALSPDMLARFVVEGEIHTKEKLSDERYVEQVVLLEQTGLEALSCEGRTSFMAEAAFSQEGRLAFSKWVQDKVRDLEHLKGVCAQQLEYIEHLKSDKEALLDQRTREVDHLNAKLNRTFRRRLKALFR